MRIASLVPSSTEMLFALGLGEDVVAVTHECDFPPEAASLPQITRSVIPESLTAAEIDRAVRERTEAGEAIYELDEYLLAELAPNLIVTQAVCEVCAVSFDDVRAVAERIASKPEVLSLDPTTLGEVLADVPAWRRPWAGPRPVTAWWPRRAIAWTQWPTRWTGPPSRSSRRSSGSIPCSWAATGYRR